MADTRGMANSGYRLVKTGSGRVLDRFLEVAIRFPAGTKIGSMLLEGIFAPATTPFYSDERVYLKKLEFNIGRLSLTALSGLVILGSTGEAGPWMTERARQSFA